MQFKRGLRLLKGVVCLLFLSNVPGAMFIQGCTFILDFTFSFVKFDLSQVQYPSQEHDFSFFVQTNLYNFLCMLIYQRMINMSQKF